MAWVYDESRKKETVGGEDDETTIAVTIVAATAVAAVAAATTNNVFFLFFPSRERGGEMGKERDIFLTLSASHFPIFVVFHRLSSCTRGKWPYIAS